MAVLSQVNVTEIESNKTYRKNKVMNLKIIISFICNSKLYLHTRKNSFTKYINLLLKENLEQNQLINV